MAKFFAGMDVREMNFNCRHTNRRNGIVYSHASMCVSCSINYNCLKFSFGLLNPSDQITFNI